MLLIIQGDSLKMNQQYLIGRNLMQILFCIYNFHFKIFFLLLNLQFITHFRIVTLYIFFQYREKLANVIVVTKLDF